MAAISDLGGRREYFGPIDREVDEPVFHEDWEGRVFGLSFYVQVALGPPNLDAGRHAMEQLPPDVYHASYYHRWFGFVEGKVRAAGYLEESVRRRGARFRRTMATVSIRPMLHPRLPPWFAGRVLPRLLGGARPTLRHPRFAAGDRVRVRAEQAEGHTRQPGYVTGRTGTVIAQHSAALFADAHAVGRRELQHLYTVEFAGSELWGDDAEPGTEVRIELFEPYLEAA